MQLLGTMLGILGRPGLRSCQYPGRWRRRRLERAARMTLRASAWRVLAGHGRSVALGDRPRSEAAAGWTRDGRLEET